MENSLCTVQSNLHTLHHYLMFIMTYEVGAIVITVQLLRDWRPITIQDEACVAKSASGRARTWNQFCHVDFNRCAFFCRTHCQGKKHMWLKRLLKHIFEREGFGAWHHLKLFAFLHLSWLPVTWFPRGFCGFSELPWPQGTSGFETPAR